MFTLDEARATLRQLMPHLERMVRAAGRAEELESGIVAAARQASGNGQTGERVPERESEGRSELELIRQALADAVRAVAAAGAEVKDLRRGLLDFPTERGGEIVYLCYEYGEPDIGYWHPVDTGYAGRRPLSEF